MIHIVVPAYNEEGAIGTLLDRLGERLGTVPSAFRILVVDDGSTDMTVEEVESRRATLPLELVRFPANRGVAEVFRVGLARACAGADPGDVVVTLDGDGTQDPSVLVEMVRRIREGQDLVVASCLARGAVVTGVPASRLWLSRTLHLILRLVFPIPGITDYTGFCRAYRVGLLQRAMAEAAGRGFIRSEGFPGVAEILLRLRRYSPKAVTIPLVYRYDRKRGPSKLRVWPTIRGYLRLMAGELTVRWAARRPPLRGRGDDGEVGGQEAAPTRAEGRGMMRGPIAGVPLTPAHLAAGLHVPGRGPGLRTQFEAALSAWNGGGWCRATSSGKAAFFLLLRALHARRPERTEVVLPAYTDAALVHPVRRAGLTPVLCEMNVETFNLDPDRLDEVVNNRTLAVTVVYTFGIPADLDAVGRVAGRAGAAVIGDAAQALGARWNGRAVTSWGDGAFVSFGRGKNIPLGGGGAAFCREPGLSEAAEREWRACGEPGLAGQALQPFHLTLLALAMRPWAYRAFRPAILAFRNNHVPTGFCMERMSGYRAGVGSALLRELDRWTARRREVASAWTAELSGRPGIRVPRIPAGAEPAFNRFPVLYGSAEALERAIGHFAEAGVEARPLYPHPVHHVFDLGYRREEFPVACELAERLLTIPCHPLVHGVRA